MIQYLGTRWTAPGAGATVRELREAGASTAIDPDCLGSTRTAIELTGQPLSAYDIRRIAEATRGDTKPRRIP